MLGGPHWNGFVSHGNGASGASAKSPSVPPKIDNPLTEASNPPSKIALSALSKNLSNLFPKGFDGAFAHGPSFVAVISGQFGFWQRYASNPRMKSIASNIDPAILPTPPRRSLMPSRTGPSASSTLATTLLINPFVNC